MSQYDYSVKEMLAKAFGSNTVFEMRRPMHENTGPDMLLPLCWQYADKEAVSICLEDKYLIDTILADDYIAYIIQKNDTKYAYLMFMLAEEESPFRIDTEYAISILDDWKAKGFEPRILSVCISIKYYGKDISRFYSGSHMCAGKGLATYKLEAVNGTRILVYDSHSCWAAYFKKIVSVSQSYQLTEYECLFEPCVEITRGVEKDRTVVSKGCRAVKEFFEANAPVYSGYTEFGNTSVYSPVLAAGDTELIIHVNRHNLISEINLKPIGHERIIAGEGAPKQSLLASIPVLVNVRALDPVEMHGFAIQLTYADHSVRNYYLGSFEEWSVLDEMNMNGYTLTKEQLQSVSVNTDNGVSFDGGYSIPSWQLFYHSYRQLIAEMIGDVKYEDNEILVKEVYRIPLLEFKRHFYARQYWGSPEECYGPAKALFDNRGNRISDVSFYTMDNDAWCRPTLYLVCVEPTCRYGFMNADGSWLAPPIYTKAKEFHKGCTEVSRIVSGIEKDFLLTKAGEEKSFDFSIDTERFGNDRCAFNAEKWEGDLPDAGYYWDCEWVTPGKWGFMNAEGTVVIEPQYVFAAGFYNGGDEHSVVAKFVDGSLRWGVIDLHGNETVPCRYSELFCCWGEAVAFKREGGEQYGLMDFDGNIIVEPTFDCIEEYDEKHGLITAGENEDALGVYSIEEKRMLIPEEFDCVDYGDRMIRCEVAWTCKMRYFDYEGNELDFSEYDSVYEHKGNLRVRKDDTSWLIDWNRNVLVPQIMENEFVLYSDHCDKGLMLVGSKKLKGLSSVDGRVILPQVFSDITIKGDFVIGSQQTDGNWRVCDTLFFIDGTPVLSGPYRNIHLDHNTITAETPLGKEHYEIIRKHK